MTSCRRCQPFIGPSGTGSIFMVPYLRKKNEGSSTAPKSCLAVDRDGELNAIARQKCSESSAIWRPARTTAEIHR